MGYKVQTRIVGVHTPVLQTVCSAELQAIDLLKPKNHHTIAVEL